MKNGTRVKTGGGGFIILFYFRDILWHLWLIIEIIYIYFLFQKYNSLNIIFIHCFFKGISM